MAQGQTIGLIKSARSLTLNKMLIDAGRRRGERVLRPVKLNGSTNLYAFLYLANHRERPVNTLDAHFRAIALLDAVAILFDIEDLEYRVSYGRGLTTSQLKIINEALSRKERDIHDLAAKKLNGAAFANLNDVLDQLPRASRGTEALRKTSVIKYLRHLMEAGDGVLTNYVVSDADIEARRDAYQEITAKIVPPETSPRSKRTHFNPYDLAQLESFLEEYEPSRIWQDPIIALRNQVMFDLQFYGGLRRSEVLLLQFPDFVHGRGRDHPNQIHVTAKRNDPSDRRKKPPAAKTGSGVITVPEFVFARYESWKDAYEEVLDHAINLGLTENVRHNFVFVAASLRQHKSYGSPLTIDGFDYAFNALLKTARIKGTISTHALRHLCAMRYVRRRRALGDNNDQIQKGMREFFRWSRMSSMPAYYTAHEDHALLYNDLIQDKKFLEEL